MTLVSQNVWDIEQLTAQWHGGDSDLPLHVYCGMSWGEWREYVEHNRVPIDWPARPPLSARRAVGR